MDSLKSNAITIVAGVVVILLLYSSFFKIDQTELGNVRRLGVALYAQPLKPGLHFKIPLFDTADRVQVTLTTLHIPPFEVMTVDNQKVTLDMNFNFTIPPEKVNHVLYEIGRAGNVDIQEQIIPVAKDRASRIFAIQNMVNINAGREKIQEEIEASVSKSVIELFGIQPHSLQIAAIKPSDAFMASNEAAVKAKNDAVAAENTARIREFEAKQVQIKAKGEADAAIEQARGRAESTRLEAEANKLKLVLQGEGEKARLEAEIRALGSPGTYIQYLHARAQLNWNGQQPQIVAGNGAGANFILPLPTMNTPPSAERSQSPQK